LEEWFDTVVNRLDEWRATYPSPTGFVSTEWLDLNYHMTLTLVFRPTPANPNPGRQATKKALHSSSATMRVYKEMYRKGRINYSQYFEERMSESAADLASTDWLAMYHLFMSGVTYLNSLWQAHKNDWSIVPSLVEALLDMQGCASIMEALAGQ
jgi:hypothetical protein